MADRGLDLPARPGANRLQRQAAEEAFRRVLARTGDVDRAKRVRASLLGEPVRVSPLTARAARSGRLPSTSIADTGVRANLEAAGVPVKIPEGGAIGQFGQDILRAAVDAPMGYLALAQLMAQAAVPGGADPDVPGRVGAALHGFTQDVRHPLRHPGYTLLDALALLSLGGAGALRAPTAIERASTAAGEARRVTKQVKAGEARRVTEQVKATRRAAKQRVKAVREAERRERAAHSAARRAAGQAKRLGRSTVKPLEAGLGPLVYPATKGYRLAKQPPSLTRSADTAALALGTTAAFRRAREERRAAGRLAREAEAIRTYR